MFLFIDLYEFLYLDYLSVSVLQVSWLVLVATTCPFLLLLLHSFSPQLFPAVRHVAVLFFAHFCRDSSLSRLTLRQLVLKASFVQWIDRRCKWIQERRGWAGQSGDTLLLPLKVQSVGSCLDFSKNCCITVLYFIHEHDTGYPRIWIFCDFLARMQGWCVPDHSVPDRKFLDVAPLEQSVPWILCPWQMCPDPGPRQAYN